MRRWLVVDHVEFDGVAVDYEVTGSGDQVVLLHARAFVGWYAPLVDVLSEYSVLRYRRTVPLDGRPFSIDDDAAVCARLVDLVGFDRPHLVGHSYGGLVALALARSRVVPLRSIALLEPAGSGLLDPEQATAGSGPALRAVPDAWVGGGSRAVSGRRARRGRPKSARSLPARRLRRRRRQRRSVLPSRAPGGGAVEFRRRRRPPHRSADPQRHRSRDRAAVRPERGDRPVVVPRTRFASSLPEQATC